VNKYRIEIPSASGVLKMEHVDAIDYRIYEGTLSLLKYEKGAFAPTEYKSYAPGFWATIEKL
jgi:hypothetical protein